MVEQDSEKDHQKQSFHGKTKSHEKGKKKGGTFKGVTHAELGCMLRGAEQLGEDAFMLQMV